MGISAVEREVPKAETVTVTKDTLRVELSDGRSTFQTPRAPLKNDELISL